jgi:hypothetical protein
MEIVVISGPDSGKQLEITGPCSIGRDPTNDLVLVDDVASVRHALLRPVSGDSVELTDLSSRNGTWLDGDRVTSPSLVPDGATIGIGYNVLRISGLARAGRSQADSDETAVMAPTRAPLPTDSPTVHHAGPVAGGNVSISGHHAAGRDLYYHEGFRVRSRMTRSARRLLYTGLFLFFVPTIIGAVAIVLGQQTLFTATSDNGDEIFAQFGVWLAVAGIALVVSFVGVMVIVIALVMRREKIREPIR